MNVYAYIISGIKCVCEIRNLTHCGLATPYGVKDHGKRYFRQ